MRYHYILHAALFLAVEAALTQQPEQCESDKVKGAPVTKTTFVHTLLNNNPPQPAATGQDNEEVIARVPATATATASGHDDYFLELPPDSYDRTVVPDEDGTAGYSSGMTGISRVASPAAGTYRNAVYFTNWGIYAANHQPQDIAADKITHLLYSFADIRTDGTVVGSDSYADVEKRYPSDSQTETGTNAYGCIKQIFLQKKKHRQLKPLLSIGGWTWSPKFAPVAASADRRKRFATTAVKLMGDWGFDGIDIDWEYPKDAKEAADFVKLLKECRKALDAYAKRYAPGYRFAMTIAVPAGRTNYERLDIRNMVALIDGWHLMAYDYTGSWESSTGHQSNLYKSRSNPRATPADTNTALAYYLSKGVKPRNILLGMPLYGRSFAGTDGLGKPYAGLGGGSVEAGIYQYKALPRPGATERYDGQAVAVYSYDVTSRELVTYDNVRSTTAKARYLRSKNLGGAVFWESSGDRRDSKSLVRTMAKGMGRLDNKRNWLKYPGSRYQNIRQGVPGR